MARTKEQREQMPLQVEAASEMIKAGDSTIAIEAKLRGRFGWSMSPKELASLREELGVEAPTRVSIDPALRDKRNKRIVELFNGGVTTYAEINAKIMEELGVPAHAYCIATALKRLKGAKKKRERASSMAPASGVEVMKQDPLEHLLARLRDQMRCRKIDRLSITVEGAVEATRRDSFNI